MKRFFTLILSILCAFAAFPAEAQEMNSLQFRRRVQSPELTPDSLTFRFVAPKARQVSVSASWLGYRPDALPMVQGADGI